MAIYVKDEELLSYALLELNAHTANSSGTLYVHEGKVYKLFSKDYSKRINYLRSLPLHPHVLPILDEIVPEWTSDFQSGYITEYKENAKTFLELFCNHLEYSEKEKYIHQIFSALKHLHQFIVLGDIHGDNFFVHNNKAYICDLDYYHKINEKCKPFKNRYIVSKVERKKPTKYTDLIKTYIESYSLLFEEDFSSLILQFGYKNFCNFMLQCSLSQEMLSFIKYSLQMIKEKRIFEEMYDPHPFITENVLNNKEQLIKHLKNL